MLAKEIFKDPNTTIQYYNPISAGGLLILAWKITTDNHTKHPLWEFLRHCRNVTAHKGNFNFINGEPRKPAIWKSLEITKDLHEHPLFPAPPKENPQGSLEKGFLGIGDVLYMLADIEKEFYT